jgi:hypothetical protein
MDEVIDSQIDKKQSDNSVDPVDEMVTNYLVKQLGR